MDLSMNDLTGNMPLGVCDLRDDMLDILIADCNLLDCSCCSSCQTHSQTFPTGTASRPIPANPGNFPNPTPSTAADMNNFPTAEGMIGAYPTPPTPADMNNF